MTIFWLSIKAPLSRTLNDFDHVILATIFSVKYCHLPDFAEEKIEVQIKQELTKSHIYLAGDRTRLLIQVVWAQYL